MSDYVATNLQNVLDSQPAPGWEVSFANDNSAVRLFGGFTPKAGRFQWVNYTDANSTAGPATSSTDLSTGDTMGRAKVTADPQLYQFRVILNGRDLAMAGNGAVDNTDDYMLQELEGGMISVYSQISTDICVTSTVDGKINSIPHVLPGPTGSDSYYDQARTNAWTNPTNVSASDGEKLQLSHFEDLDSQFAERGQEYDMVLMSVKNKHWYEQLMRASGSFTGVKEQSLNDIHFLSPMYDSKPVVSLPKLSDTEVYYINSEDIELWYQPQTETDFGDKMVDRIWKVEQMAKTTDNDVFLVKAYLNFILKNPYRQGVIFNLTSP